MQPANKSLWKIKIILFSFYIFLGAILLFLARWQIFGHERYSALAKQRITDATVASTRGRILASDGSPLAYSATAFDVYVAINELEYAEEKGKQTREEFISKIGPILELEKDEIKEIMDSGPIYVKVKDKILPDEKQELSSLRRNNNPNAALEGLHFEQTELRTYPDNDLACHVIGFMGKTIDGDEVGRNGIEGYWDGDLSWKKGFLYEERDSFGNQILTGEYEPIKPKVGRTIKLTIDRGLQKEVERLIEEGVEQYKSKSGTVVIMDPKTGAILAMANYPRYNPNKYWEIEEMWIFNNKAVADPYEFGSVGKAFTVSTAVEEDLIDPETVIFEHHDGCVNVLDEKDICTADKKPQGPMTTTDVLVHSDNIGAFMIGERVGGEKLYEKLRAFGLGSMTNLGLSEESTSIIKHGKYWNRTDLATASFGQTISATPIQLVSGYSALANHGVRMQPHIVSEISDEEKTIRIEPKIASQPVSKETAEITTDMLTTVYEKSGMKWHNKEVAQYKLAGKSGTAQIPNRFKAGYNPDAVNVTFVGYDASDESKFVMLVKLQEPEGAPYSIDTVVPLWTDMFVELKDYLGMVPQGERY